MESRTAVVLRVADQRPGVLRRGAPGCGSCAARCGPLVRFRMPPGGAAGMARPAAARRYLERLAAAGPRRSSALPAGTPGEQRLDDVERALSRTLPDRAAHVPGLAVRAGPAARGPGRRRSTRWTPRLADEVLRSLPHNVTSEMDLELWALASPGARDAASAAALSGTPGGRAGRSGTGRGALPRAAAGRAGRLPRAGTGTVRWPRSTSACPAGPTIPPTCSGCWPTTCGWTTRAGSGRPVRPGRAGRRGDDLRGRGRRAAPLARRARRWCAGCCAGPGS